MGDTRANQSNVNIDYATTSRDDVSDDGDNMATLSNINIDYATTSRDDESDEGAIFEWAIIGQTSQTLILTMQRLPEMT